MSQKFGTTADEEREGYLHGQCHLLAVALQRLTRRPITAALAYDWDVEQDVLVHCWISLDVHGVLDASGITTVADSLMGYPDGDDASTLVMTAKDLLAIGEGIPMEELSPNQLKSLEARVSKATSFASKLINEILLDLDRCHDDFEKAEFLRQALTNPQQQLAPCLELLDKTSKDVMTNRTDITP